MEFQDSLFSAPDGTYVRVALNLPVRREFSYFVPERAGKISPGVRVKVDFGPRKIVGVVVAVESQPPKGVAHDRVKDVIECLDEQPLITFALLRLARQIADDAYCSWGQALAAMLPAALRRDRVRQTILTIEQDKEPSREETENLEAKFPKQAKALAYIKQAGGPIEVRTILNRAGLSKSPLNSLVKKGWARFGSKDQVLNLFKDQKVRRDTPPILTGEQDSALQEILKVINNEAHSNFLLHGITSSGKTEVYLRALEECLAKGKSGIVLVPEISLTPQTVSRFRSRCGDVAVLHSGLTDTERHDQWLAIRRGDVQIVVGARSALFAPVKDLGIIIVDEEHESTFKQESTPRYQARDVACQRARLENAVCILGSATPSLETWHLAHTKSSMKLLSLTNRVAGGVLPKVKVIDMRSEQSQDGRWPVLSSNLEEALRKTIRLKEQAILFLNQRGFAPAWYCRGCAKTLACTKCDVALTYHRWREKALCHYCLKEEPIPTLCHKCGKKVEMIGVGTERVEASVKRLFPDINILRMDRDTMLRRESYEESLDKFSKGDYDVLLGTQMVAKGLDFPNVTLVGVLNADTALHQPDFRSSERCFNLIAQVSGRAGRSAKGGDVIVQTWMPDHEAIVSASRHDFEAFAGHELDERKEWGYPPFGEVVRIMFESQYAEKAKELAQSAFSALSSVADVETELLGPAAPPIEKVRNKYRQQIMIKTTRDGLHQVNKVLFKIAEQQGVKVDPQ